MSIMQHPRMIWFGTQINVSTPASFCIEGSKRQGEFRLMIANEAPINAKRQVIVWVISLFIPGFYFPSSLSLIFSYKMTEDREAPPFNSVSGAHIFSSDVPSSWPWAFYSVTSLPVEMLSALTVWRNPFVCSESLYLNPHTIQAQLSINAKLSRKHQTFTFRIVFAATSCGNTASWHSLKEFLVKLLKAEAAVGWKKKSPTLQSEAMSIH